MVVRGGILLVSSAGFTLVVPHVNTDTHDTSTIPGILPGAELRDRTVNRPCVANCHDQRIGVGTIDTIVFVTGRDG